MAQVQRHPATPHLTALCRAFNETARELSSDPHALGAKLPPTRACCDDLDFKDYDEAAAYMVQHLTDRYGRVTQVLERLFAAGHLPLRQASQNCIGKAGLSDAEFAAAKQRPIAGGADGAFAWTLSVSPREELPDGQ